MHSPIKRYLHNETPCSYGLTVYYAQDSGPHLPVTPAQLMRPGIGRNTSCAVGDFVQDPDLRPRPAIQTCLFLFRRCSLLHCSCKHFRNAKWEYFVTTWDCDFILILYSTVVWTHTWRPQNRSDLTNQRIQLAIRKVSAWKIMPYMEMIGILPSYNTMKCQLKSMSGTLLGTCRNVSYSPK